MKQIDKVLKHLRKNAYHEYNARTLSRVLSMKEDTVKVYLNRLHNKALILRTSKGFYKAIADLAVLREQQLTNPPTLLHGILLECRMARSVTKRQQGTPPSKDFCYFDDKRLVRWLVAHDFGYRRDNGRYTRFLWWEARKVCVDVFGDGRILVYLNSSSRPIGYPEFENFLSFLDGFFSEVAPFRDRRVVRLREVGLARDFKELRLDGVKSVSLRAFKNAFARIYFKDDLGATRVEHHLVLDMDLDMALRSLSVLSTPESVSLLLASAVQKVRPDELRDVA